jgi:hypothetical protein
VNPDKSPKTSASTRDRGKALGKPERGLPCVAPPPGTNGRPRRLYRRAVGVTAAMAIEWAKAQSWWPLVTNAHGWPYSDQRWYVFVLREEPKP